MFNVFFWGIKPIKPTEHSPNWLAFRNVIRLASLLSQCRRDKDAGRWRPPDPCTDLSEKVRVTAGWSKEAATHTCRISACCPSSGSTGGSRWRESLSSRWSRRRGPSRRTTGCCCHWRRDEGGWQSHRRYWSLRKSLRSHEEKNGGGREEGREECYTFKNCGHIYEEWSHDSMKPFLQLLQSLCLWARGLWSRLTNSLNAI